MGVSDTLLTRMHGMSAPMAFLFLAFCILNFCVLGVGGKTTSALCPCGLVNCPPCLPSFPLSSPPPLPEVMSSLREHGMLVFTGIGNNYVAAIQKLRMEAPRCLEDAMSVEMEDGSQRFTTGRDSMGSSQPFPSCLSDQVEIVTDAFDEVDTVFHWMLRQQFGQRLDLTVGEAARRRRRSGRTWTPRPMCTSTRPPAGKRMRQKPCLTTPTTGCMCLSLPRTYFISMPLQRTAICMVQ